VTVYVTSLLGRADDEPFARRRVVEFHVSWDEASRRRLRRKASDGTDVAIDLDDGGYLADGQVLADDGERVLVVSRSAEPALVVRFDPNLPPGRLLHQALMVGHVFGNQHTPLDIACFEVRVPLTTSEAVARATVEGIGLKDISVTIARIALGKQRPLTAGHRHERER
jgi:urease accessory protein